jgi:hypothetical protein
MLQMNQELELLRAASGGRSHASSDIIYLPVSRSVTHTIVKNAAAGARLIAMTEFTEDDDSRGLEDFSELKLICLKVAAHFNKGDSIANYSGNRSRVRTSKPPKCFVLYR